MLIFSVFLSFLKVFGRTNLWSLCCTMLQSSFHVFKASAGGSCYDFTTLQIEKVAPLLGPQWVFFFLPLFLMV